MGIETNFVAGVGAIERLLQLRLLLSQYGVYGCTDSLRKSSVACDYLLESKCHPRVVFRDCKKSKI